MDGEQERGGLRQLHWGKPPSYPVVFPHCSPSVPRSVDLFMFGQEISPPRSLVCPKKGAFMFLHTEKISLLRISNGAFMLSFRKNYS